VQLKVDTGLGRNGVTPADLPALAARAAALQSAGEIAVTGVWTHFAYADSPGHPTIAQQKLVFDEAVRTVEAAGIEVEFRHMANSAATLTAPAMHYDLVRPGLAVYGLSPVPRQAQPSDFGLRPAMTVQAHLATVKDVPAGQGLSYGHAYVTGEATRIGVVPMGYADGVPRHASGGTIHPTGVLPAVRAPAGTPERMGVGGPVLVGEPGTGGRVLRVAGRVCMDQFMLDLGPASASAGGDVVTLFGASDGLARVPNAEAVPNAQDWAEAAGTISYEIVTRIGARVPRVYLAEGDLN
jgi:alanine racemase